MKKLLVLISVVCALVVLAGCSRLVPNLDKTNAASSSATTTTSPSANATAKLLTRDQAKAAALAHAGVHETDVFDLEIELEKERGVSIYDITFETAEYEFDYDIHAETGEILRSQKERHD